MLPNSLLPDHIELFRYLRSLVDTAEQSRDPYPKFALVEAYWHIGRIIVETEQDGTERADYGIHLIEILSQRLTEAFGNGYSLPNMWRFKQFYLAFQILSTRGRELPNLRQHLRTELCWSHYRLLMQLENVSERTFYEHRAADERWPVRVLQRFINTRFYHQTALGEDHLIAGVKKISAIPKSGFPSTPTSVIGSSLLRTRLATIKKTLLEQYVGYAFMAQRQYLSVMGQDYWLELVFFNYVINRFVVIHLGEHDSATLALFRQVVDAYIAKQPPGFSTYPIGLLVDSDGVVEFVATSLEVEIDITESSSLPYQL